MVSKRKILVVDDSEINRRLLCEILSEEYETLEAEDGRQALELLRAESKCVSAVLLDLIMPKMDGYAFLRRQRQEQSIAHIPVIVTTQDEGEDSEVRALSLGACDFLKKPYQPAIILHRLANTIHMRETAALINLAERDLLTGVYSRDFFYQKVAEQLECDPEGDFFLLCADVEKFKLVNDLYGVDEGDRLLRCLAEVLQKCVSEHILCGRMGADTFVLLLPGEGQCDAELLEQIRYEVETHFSNINITVRFGVYVIAGREVPVSAMCDRAKLAVDSIKGKYDVVFAYYNDSLREKMLREQSIVNSMKQGLEQGEFEVYYQPKYDLKTKQIVGCEALVRWRHAENGFMAPAQFIPVFEKNGFIADLDRFVWERACSDMRGWRDAGLQELPVSVNVSRVDIYNPHFAAHLLQLVGKYGLSARLLHLEITESAYTENPQQLIAAVTELKQLGFVIEMDDFGSGYSSLNMLSELPIDVLKLDMCFLRGNEAHRNSENILSFIVNLAKWMGLSVVAEGIETEMQFIMLRNMEADYGQGYFFAKPMPKEEFDRLLPVSRPAPEQAAVPAAPELASGKKKRIMLVVDDSMTARARLARIFSEDFRVEEAPNGAAAISYLLKHKGRVDVIVLDMVMPVMDGAATLQQLKSLTLLRSIPAIVQSDFSEETELRMLEQGAADFVSKSSPDEVLRRRVHNVLASLNLAAVRGDITHRTELDALTGLYRKEEFEQRAAVMLAQEHETDECPALILLDINDLRYINSGLGYQRGDEVLHQVAEELQKNSNAGDFLGRLDEDEFALLTLHKGTAQELRYRIANLCQRLSFTSERPEGTLQISCSVGAALYPAHGHDYATLLENAQTALREAKQSKRSRYKLYGQDKDLQPMTLFNNMGWLLDEVSDGVYVRDAATYEVLYMNRTAAEMLRRLRYECIGKRCYEVVWGLEKPCVDCYLNEMGSKVFRQCIMTQADTGRELLVRGKEVEWNGAPAVIQYLRDMAQALPEGPIAYKQQPDAEIEQSGIAEDLQLAREQLQYIGSCLDGGYLLVETGRTGKVRVLHQSPGLCALLGVKQHALPERVGSDMFSFVDAMDVPRLQNAFRMAQELNAPVDIQCRVLRDDGEFVRVRLCAKKLREKQDKQTYCVLYLRAAEKPPAARDAWE